MEIWGFLVSTSHVRQVALVLQTWHLLQHGIWGFKSSSLQLHEEVLTSEQSPDPKAEVFRGPHLFINLSYCYL